MGHPFRFRVSTRDPERVLMHPRPDTAFGIITQRASAAHSRNGPRACRAREPAPRSPSSEHRQAPCTKTFCLQEPLKTPVALQSPPAAGSASIISKADWVSRKDGRVWSPASIDRPNAGYPVADMTAVIDEYTR